MYTQGMNEVLAMLYFTFTHVTLAEMPILDLKYNESNLFHAFSTLMVDLRDGFLRELDQEETGIQGHISHYTEVLKHTDPDLLKIIEDENVIHQFYTLRWFMLLMCQEFSMTDTMRLWDTLMSAEGTQINREIGQTRFQFIDFVVVALVQGIGHIIRGKETDFACIMEHL